MVWWIRVSYSRRTCRLLANTVHGPVAESRPPLSLLVHVHTRSVSAWFTFSPVDGAQLPAIDKPEITAFLKARMDQINVLFPSLDFGAVLPVGVSRHLFVQSDPKRNLELHSQQLHVGLRPIVPQAGQVALVTLTVFPGIVPGQISIHKLDAVISQRYIDISDCWLRLRLQVRVCGEQRYVEVFSVFFYNSF